MKIKTLYKNLDILKNFCSVDETRQILHGVFVEPCAAGGLFAVATNGRVIGIFYDPDGYTDGKYLIDVKRMTRIFDLRPAPSVSCEQEAEEIREDQTYYHDNYVVVIDDKSLDVFDGDRLVDSSNDLCLLSDADKYPNYKNMLAAKIKPIAAVNEYVNCNINPDFLALFAFGEFASDGISLYVADNCKKEKEYLRDPVYVLNNCDKNFLGLVMPMVGDNKELSKNFGIEIVKNA
ncbi:MAG: hypothetical protein LBL00_08515 [Endomicrobium sp.]|jgi:hypothetical protein|nr:hypothetical protein [Endomicrobium sp.]